MTFPIDPVTLDMLHDAIHISEGSERTSLFELLDLLAGIDPTTDAEHQVEIGDGIVEDDRIHFSPHDVISALIDEVRKLRLAMDRLNRLRSNVVMTQSCSWSNTTYPLVAILGEAGYECEGATKEQMEEHLHCYDRRGGDRDLPKVPRLLDHTPAPGKGILPDGRSPLMAAIHDGRTERNASGSVAIDTERWRQKDEEGWTPEHDDEHTHLELSSAASCYLDAARAQMSNREPRPPLSRWPWDPSWWKPSPDPQRNLVKAGALIAAEYDRLERAKPKEAEADGGAEG